jgi:hypothetical protein
MTKEELYQLWRPQHLPWSPWVKPVIFAFLRPEGLSRQAYPVREWHVPLSPDTAIIADLTGADGVSAGIALARAGYRPILGYNACPTGDYEPEFISITNSQPTGAPVAVDMSAILTAVCVTSSELASLKLSDQAPPVFLLDANRHGFGIHGPGWFDNRSFVSPSDFPSPDYLISHGISKLILLQLTSRVASDLLQVLLHLQEKGITIATQTPWAPWAPCVFVVKPPMFLRSAWERLYQKLGYRHNSLNGSFGAIVPPSAS